MPRNARYRRIRMYIHSCELQAVLFSEKGHEKQHPYKHRHIHEHQHTHQHTHPGYRTPVRRVLRIIMPPIGNSGYPDALGHGTPR